MRIPRLAKIIANLLNKDPDKLLSIESDDIIKDQRAFHKLFHKGNEDIRVSKDPDGNKLFFKKRK